MVVDLSREYSGFVDGLRNRGRLIALPLAPKTGPEEGGEWNHAGNHQGQQTRSNAAQHPLPPVEESACRPTAVARRGRAESVNLSARRNCLVETLFRRGCGSGEKA